MEEEYLPPFHLNLDTQAQLVKIAYVCRGCSTDRILHQQYPQEITNKDFRFYCATCKIISFHDRHLPPKES